MQTGIIVFKIHAVVREALVAVVRACLLVGSLTSLGLRPIPQLPFLPTKKCSRKKVAPTKIFNGCAGCPRYIFQLAPNIGAQTWENA